MNTISRKLTPIEQKKLKARIKEYATNAERNLNWKAILIMLIVGILSGIHIYFYDKSNWSLITKFLVVLMPIGIWVLVENYFKDGKWMRIHYRNLKDIEAKTTTEVYEIDIKRIALMPEYEDEGNLYLIENSENQCLYLGDYEYLIGAEKDFPSSKIEVYADDTMKLVMDRKIRCFGEKLEMEKIDAEKKWIYFGKVGFDDDLKIIPKSFEEILKEINEVN